VSDELAQQKWIERLTAQRDAALEVAAESFREALTAPIHENGKPGPSILDLSHARRLTVDGEKLVNFQLQYVIADEMRRWLVPPEHRPICPLNGKPCTSWTCLVDVCDRPTTEGEKK
jgi:hypothetical protein